MAAELVETSRLFARTVANIEPGWIERVGAHLLKKSHGEPHWEKKAGQVMAFERATLYGLVVYAQRRVPYGPIEPGARARDLHPRGAGRGRLRDARAVLRAQPAAGARDRELEHKSRRLDVLVDDELIFAFYDAAGAGRRPHGARSSRSGGAAAEREQPKRLFLSRDDLMRHEAAGVTTDLFPQAGRDARRHAARSTYHFEPGAPRDGVTLTVPLYALNQIDAGPLRVAGARACCKEKVHLLLKSLPQKLRRHLVPVPEYAAGFVERIGERAGQLPLVDALIADIRARAQPRRAARRTSSSRRCRRTC